jgi:hypothetical protein
VARDRDIERMARHLIERHGARAAQVADDRLADLVKSGEHGAAAVWRKIAAAIREMQR